MYEMLPNSLSPKAKEEDLAIDEAGHHCEPERLANLATPIKPALR
jgi:hypothetical protein